MEINELGKHIIADFYGCPSHLIDDEKYMIEKLEEAAKEANMTILKTASWKFQPVGCTVIILLAESHISAHSEPENGRVFIDAYTCGTKSDPVKAVEILAEAFKPERKNVTYIPRGFDI